MLIAIPKFNNLCMISIYVILFLLYLVGFSPKSYSQQTNNSSSLTNSAAPSASSVTTGGTNINYQSNNTFNNDTGFAPGIYCRTPTLYIGGNWGNSSLDAFDPIQVTGNKTLNYAVNAGLVLPFGSQIIDYCKQLALSIAKDREISSQLSMLRTCYQLEKEGLVVDPQKYPLLKPCVKDTKSSLNNTNNNPPPPVVEPQNIPPASLKPKTIRVL
jgi:hypothetical protein